MDYKLKIRWSYKTLGLMDPVTYALEQMARGVHYNHPHPPDSFGSREDYLTYLIGYPWRQIGVTTFQSVLGALHLMMGRTVTLEGPRLGLIGEAGPHGQERATLASLPLRYVEQLSKAAGESLEVLKVPVQPPTLSNGGVLLRDGERPPKAWKEHVVITCRDARTLLLHDVVDAIREEVQTSSYLDDVFHLLTRVEWTGGDRCLCYIKDYPAFETTKRAGMSLAQLTRCSTRLR